MILRANLIRVFGLPVQLSNSLRGGYKYQAKSMSCKMAFRRRISEPSILPSTISSNSRPSLRQSGDEGFAFCLAYIRVNSKVFSFCLPSDPDAQKGRGRPRIRRFPAHPACFSLSVSGKKDAVLFKGLPVLF